MLGSSAQANAELPPQNRLNGIVNNLAKRIFNGERITYDPELLASTATTLLNAMTTGYGKSLSDVDYDTPDFNTLCKLTENVFQFSASKDFHILQDMTLALKDTDGKLRSFSDFQKEVDKMNLQYNGNWLRTEYNHAVAASQCAARWTEQVSCSQSMPYLQYQAVMDKNTRPEHAALNGVIKRIDSDFWDKYYPPNGWGCRCEVIQLPGKNHKETPDMDLKHCKVAPMFQVNVGKKGVIFPKGHPYFMSQCQRCNGTPKQLAINPQCAACVAARKECDNYVKKCQIKAELLSKRKHEFNQLQVDENYINVKFDKKTGAIIAEHKEHIHHSAKKEDTFFGGLTSTMLERDCQNELFRMGHKAILEKEKVFDTKGNQVTALDLTFDDKPVDIATVTTDSLYGLRFVHKNNQIIRYNKRTDIKLKADSLILYFYEPTFFSEVKMEKSINFFKYFRDNNGELIEKLLKQVHCVIKGTDKIITYNIE